MRTTVVVVAALLSDLAATAQLNVPPQGGLAIWVNEDGAQGFELRAAYPNVAAETAERSAMEALPRLLAEKQWCLRGWLVTKRDVVPIDRPKAVSVAITGACRA